MGMWTSRPLAGELRVKEFVEGDWVDHNAQMAEVVAASGVEVQGGIDCTRATQNFALPLRAEGGELFRDDDEPGEVNSAAGMGASVPVKTS